MTIEDIATKICDKYSLTIDLSVPIADAIKQSQIFTPINEDIPESEKEWHPNSNN